jgi:hypothetical protein
MRKRNLQDLVQSYYVEQEVKTGWKDQRPGKEWVRYFRERWSHRVKVREAKEKGKATSWCLLHLQFGGGL